MEQSTAAARFWVKVDKAGPAPEHHPDLGACWLWTAGTNRGGYGNWDFGGRKTRIRKMAHRFAYELEVGPIPDGLHLDHLCRVRHCVRPSHLEAVTQQENNRRAAEVRVKVTHCPQGHEYTPENTYRQRWGARLCKACARERERKLREARPPKPPRTHCGNGHQLAEDNVYVKPNGRRECRACRRDHFAAWASRHRTT